MRSNANLTLTGETCALVPYREEHVPTYHAWMEDPGLREATASEPLSLEEEFAMQRDWASDEKKCTFIVLDRFAGAAGEGAGPEGRAETRPPGDARGPHARAAMCGDVNLFFNDHDSVATCEIEVMVARTLSRRKGIAREALRAMMAYAVEALGARTFRAKIGFANEASRSLFARLGFEEVSRSEVFREATLELALDGNAPVEEGLRGVWERLDKGEYDRGTPGDA
jgi:RimJ/RimL family protein N-acetyltransferase